MGFHRQRKSTALLLVVVALAVQLISATSPTPARHERQPARPLASARASPDLRPAVGISNDVPPPKRGISASTSTQERKSVNRHAPSRVNLPSPNAPRPLTMRLTRHGASGQSSQPLMEHLRHSTPQQSPNINAQRRVFPVPRGSVEQLKSAMPHAKPMGSLSQVQNAATPLQRPLQVSRNLQSMLDIPKTRLTRHRENVKMPMVISEVMKSEIKSASNAQTSGARTHDKNSMNLRTPEQPLTKESVHNVAASFRQLPNAPQNPVSSFSTGLPSRTMNHPKTHNVQPPSHDLKISTMRSSVPSSDISTKIPAPHTKTKTSVLPSLSPHKMQRKMSGPGTSGFVSSPATPLPRSGEAGMKIAPRIHSLSSAARGIQAANAPNLSRLSGDNISNINRPSPPSTMKINSEAMKAIPQRSSSAQESSPSHMQNSAPFPRALNQLPHVALQINVAPAKVLGKSNAAQNPAVKPIVRHILPPRPYSALMPPRRNQNSATASMSNVRQRFALNPSPTQRSAPRNIGLNSNTSPTSEVLPARSFEQKFSSNIVSESNIPKNLLVNSNTSREHASGIKQDLTTSNRAPISQQISMHPTIILPRENRGDSLIKKFSHGKKVPSKTAPASQPPDSNEHPLNIAFANSAVPNYVLKAPTPVNPEAAFPRGAGISSALIPNYFLMNPIPQSANETKNMPLANNQTNSNDTQTSFEIDSTLQDLHRDWKSEVFNRYYSTIGVKTVVEQQSLSKNLNGARKTANRTLTEAAAMLIKNRNMTSQNESHSLHAKNLTDILGMPSTITHKNSNQISESFERFSRNVNLSSQAELYAGKDGVNVTEKYPEISSPRPPQLNISSSNDTLIKKDMAIEHLKPANINTTNDDETSTNASVDSDFPENIIVADNLKNISLDSTHNVFPPLSNNSLDSDHEVDLTSDVDSNTERLPDMTTVSNQDPTEVPDLLTLSSIATTPSEMDVIPTTDTAHDEHTTSSVNLVSNIDTETEMPPEATTFQHEEPTEASNFVTFDSLSTTMSELEVNETSDSIDGENLDSSVVNITSNLEVNTERSLDTETSSYGDPTEMYNPVTTSSMSTAFSEPKISETSGLTVEETLDSIVRAEDITPTEIPIPKKSSAEITQNNNDESISKAISSNPGNSLPKPRVKEPTRQVLINNTGLARSAVRLKPNERRVVVSLVDKQGRKFYVPAVFTPTDSAQTSNDENGLSALRVKENASIYINTTPKPSVLNTADENKIKDSVAAKENKQPESTTRRSLLDAIFRRNTTTRKVTTTRSTTPRTTTQKTTTPKTTTPATKKVTNIIDLIWESVTRTTTPSTTTVAATTTEAPRVTNLIDLIWASATEASTAASEVTPPTKIETTTTYIPGVTNLIDLIWASVTDDDTSYLVETTERTLTSQPVTVSTSTDPLIPVLQDVISNIDKRLNELQREIINGNTSLAEELNLLAAQMVQGSDLLSQVPVQPERKRTYLVASEEKKERTPIRFADIVEDTPLNPVLTLLREEVNRGAERVRQEVSYLAEDTAESLRRGVEDASERVSRITATSYRGALQTRDALVGLLGSALENMSVYVSNVLQDSIQTAFGTARSVGDFIRGLNDNLVGGILRQGRAVRNLFSDTIEEIGHASDRTIEVVNRVVEKNLRTITEEK